MSKVQSGKPKEHVQRLQQRIPEARAQQQRPVQDVSQRVPPEITRDAVAQSILQAAERAEAQKGAVSKADLEDMLKRAMDSRPGQMNEAAAQAISIVVEKHKMSADARPMADIVKDADKCRKKGVITEGDLEGMMRRAWDGQKNRVDPGAATALRFVGWRDAPIMDAGARKLMTEFVSAWYTDMVESPALREGRRQLEEQLAQDKRDFKEFLTTDKSEHQRLTYDEFKEKLQTERVEASEWQSLMLWLQVGVKKNPITS